MSPSELDFVVSIGKEKSVNIFLLKKNVFLKTKTIFFPNILSTSKKRSKANHRKPSWTYPQAILNFPVKILKFKNFKNAKGFPHSVNSLQMSFPKENKEKISKEGLSCKPFKVFHSFDRHYYRYYYFTYFSYLFFSLTSQRARAKSFKF